MDWVGVLVAGLLVVANAFFVAAEFAIVKVRATRIAEMEKRGRRGAKIAREITENLDAYLSVAQVGVTLASLGLGWVGEPALARLLEPVLARVGVTGTVVHSIAIAVALTVLTSVHIVLGEQAPKLFALARSEDITLLVAWPLRAFYYLLYPFIWVLSASTKYVLGSLGLKDVSEQDGQPGYSEQELQLLLARAGVPVADRPSPDGATQPGDVPGGGPGLRRGDPRGARGRSHPLSGRRRTWRPR